MVRRLGPRLIYDAGMPRTRNDTALPRRSRPLPEPNEAHTWDARLLWASLLITLAVYAKLPTIDLMFSERYFSSAQGFVGQHTAWVMWADRYVPSIGYSLLGLGALFLICLPLLKRLIKQALPWPHWQRTVVAGILASTLASSLIVHTGLKGHVGRPRPVDTVQFGGTQPFVAVFETGSNPAVNKSFPSGHATSAFLLMAFGMVCQPRWRMRWLLIGLVAGSVVGLARIMQGMHYLGDVLFAFHVVWLSCEAVAWCMARPFMTRWFKA